MYHFQIVPVAAFVMGKTRHLGVQDKNGPLCSGASTIQAGYKVFPSTTFLLIADKLGGVEDFAL